MSKAKEAKSKVTFTFATEADGTVQVIFTIPWEVVQKAQDETVIEMAKDVQLPGFRKGKAPIAKVKEKLPQSELIEHSLSHILPYAFSDFLTESKLKIAVYPKYELTSAKDKEAWEVRATTCELPTIDLGDYKKTVAGEIRSASLKKELTKEEKEQSAIKGIMETVKITVPRILVEEEANSRLSSLLARLEKLGLSLESYLASQNKKAEDLRAEYANQARDAITLDLALSKVAEDQNIKIDPSEIEKTMEASGSDKSDERRRLIESILKRREALDFLVTLS